MRILGTDTAIPANRNLLRRNGGLFGNLLRYPGSQHVKLNGHMQVECQTPKPLDARSSAH